MTLIKSILESVCFIGQFNAQRNNEPFLLLCMYKFIIYIRFCVACNWASGE